MSMSDTVQVERKTPRKRASDRTVYGRTKITNGNGSMLPSVDGRSLWCRIRRDTINALINTHLAGVASETQTLAVRRVATLEAELVFLEDKFAKIRADGGEPDANTLNLYGLLADRQRRLADPLGWDRSTKNVTTLGDFA